MRKYLFGTLAAVSLIALTAPANAQHRWHNGGWGGPSFGVSVGVGGPAYGYADYGYADYGWNTGYYGSYAAAPGCTCGTASYGYSYPTAGYAYESYPSSYGYSYGYEPGYSYGYNDYYGGGTVGVSANFREGREFRGDRREFREGRRSVREERGMTTRTSLRERGERSEGVNIRSRSSTRGSASLRERGELSTTGRGGGESFNAGARSNATQFNASGAGSGGPNGNPNPKRSSSGTGADSGAVSEGGQLGSSGRRSRGMQ